MAEPYELSLSESAQEIASGQLSPVELAQSLLGRIDAKENLQGVGHHRPRRSAGRGRPC